MPIIHDADAGDLPALAGLFDAYRQFYDLPADLDKSAGYIAARLAARDSVLLVASDRGQELIGFCQLYPSWCSLLAAPIYVLYDVYVSPGSRG